MTNYSTTVKPVFRLEFSDIHQFIGHQPANRRGVGAVITLVDV